MPRISASLYRMVRRTGTQCGFTLIHDTKQHFNKELVINAGIDGVPHGIEKLGDTAGNPLLNIKELLFDLDLSSVRDNIVGHFSTSGTLIECHYVIEIQATMDGSCMCCGDNPMVEAPMMLYPAEMPLPPLPAPPANWNPQVVQQVNFDYQPKFERTPTVRQVPQPQPGS